MWRKISFAYSDSLMSVPFSNNDVYRIVHNPSADCPAYIVQCKIQCMYVSINYGKYFVSIEKKIG